MGQNFSDLTSVDGDSENTYCYEKNYKDIFEAITIKKEDDKLVICITLYNEREEAVLTSLYSVAQAIKYFYAKEENLFRVTLCIIADGEDKLSFSTLRLFEKLNLNQNGIKNQEYGFVIHDNWIKVNNIEHCYNELLGNDICQNSISPNNSEHLKYNLQKANSPFYEFRILLLIKEKNRGKLDSHWWFFKIICQKLNPIYCFQLDVGTAPIRQSLYFFWKYLKKQKNIGAVASRVQVPSSQKLSNLIHAWQFGDFATQKLLDWPAELISGYLTVVPGQFCAFRWEAISCISDHNLVIGNIKESTPLDNYFRGLWQLGPFESNMFLAEDRILGYEIISRKNNKWELSYLHEVLAVTDICNTLPELFRQRRRWINSSFTCNLWLIYKIVNHLKFSKKSLVKKVHSLSSIPWLVFNCFIQWLLPSFMLIFISTLTCEFSNNNVYYIRPLFIAIFSITVIIQISLFYTKGISAKYEKSIIGLTIIQIILTFICIFYWGINQENILSHLNFLSILFIETSFLFIISIIVSRKLFVGMVKNGFQYIIIRPFMMLLLTMYSFTNFHDCSWGTKGLTNSQSKKSADHKGKNVYNFKRFRFYMFMSWITTNLILVIYFFIGVDNHRRVMLNVILYFFIIFIGFRIISGLIFAMKSSLKSCR